MPRSFTALVRGRVQGVAFRVGAREEALRLGLCGWVRNTPDGHVEVHAAGEEAALQAFLSWLHRGPALARVERVEANWSTAEAAGSGFRITA